MKQLTKSTKGFTLIEMLVVLAIIGILLAVVSASFSTARQKSRDGQRKTDLKNLQLAVELYKEAYGNYPPPCGLPWAGPGPHSVPGYGGVPCDLDWIVGLAPDFISTLPTDPNQEFVIDKGYLYQSDGKNYSILAHRTVEHDTTSDGHEFQRFPPWANCGHPEDPTTYAVYSSGGACW